jgi:hypothetical protein
MEGEKVCARGASEWKGECRGEWVGEWVRKMARDGKRRRTKMNSEIEEKQWWKLRKIMAEDEERKEEWMGVGKRANGHVNKDIVTHGTNVRVYT